MSVATAGGAVNTPHHQPTAEQIRIAQLIEDKKHDHPKVQEIIQKILDVVANSNADDALLALFECDYDFEKAVALLIDKGHDIASEWRTATSHKTSKKQQRATGSNRGGQEGETDENGQQTPQRDSYNPRGKTRGGRGRNPQQANGKDSSNVNSQQNENYSGQPRSRGASAGGVGGGYRGRSRGYNRGGYRPNDRNYQQQQGQDSSIDNSVPSDTTHRGHEGSYPYRRGGGAAGNRQQFSQQEPQQQDQWDVGNWNGETLIYSRTTKDDESAFNAESNASKPLTEVSNVQTASSGGSTVNTSTSERNAQQTSSSEFDPEEAARQIKNVIGIGGSQQSSASINPSQGKAMMDLKPMINDSSTGPSNKMKSTGHPSTSKATPTPPPAPRIPHQPVVFTDRFDGGLSKIDVEFGNLDEGFDDKTANKHPMNVPTSSTFYSNTDSLGSVGKLNNTSSSSTTAMSNNPPRLTNMAHHPSNEQTSFVSPTGVPNATRPTDQLPVMNQQRLLPSQMAAQQPSMAMKTVAPSVAYAVPPPQPQINAQNMALRSLFHHPQQQEPVPLDTTYDPTAFPLQSTDFNSNYFMTAASQQQAQAHYLVPSAAPPSQGPPQTQMGTNRQSTSTNVPTSAGPATSSASTSTSSSITTKKAPAVPPGLYIGPTAAPTQAGYSTGYPPAYSVPLSVGGQQQNPAASYGALYDADHAFTSSFMPFANPQQAQSPSGTYGSVTPPVQQQGAHANNDNKAMTYQVQTMNENLLLLQQYNMRQPSNQGQGQQGVAHSPAQMGFFLGHLPTGASYSPVHPVMYAQAATSITPQQQQQATKQQGQHYNPSSNMTATEDYYARSQASSASTKEGPYMYPVQSGPTQQGPNSSTGQATGANKQQQGQSQQQQQRANTSGYHNQANPTRSYQ